MAIDYTKIVRGAFENLGPKNPLAKLRDSDKRVLFARLQLYLLEGDPKLEAYLRSKRTDDVFEMLENASDIAAKVGALAKRWEKEVLTSSNARVFGSRINRLQAWHVLLVASAKRIGDLIEQTSGKQGHKRRTQKTELLVMASEFVLLKMGKYCDEHLAELLQAIAPSSDLRDISGDSIRKKRKHFQKTYPVRYGHCIERLYRDKNRSKGAIEDKAHERDTSHPVLKLLPPREDTDQRKLLRLAKEVLQEPINREG